FDVERHFNPAYRPWQQRLAVVPDGDLFRQVREGKASVVTDQIECFTETGIQLRSGDVLEADIIITATGFEMSVLGDIAFTVDDEPVDFADVITYRGMMFTGVPNLVWVFGYFRASWTLRVDLIGDFVCRLLGHLEDRGASMVVPRLRDTDEGMALLPWLDPENFNPGYLTRSLHLLPKQGDRQPWLHTQDYMTERDELPHIDLDDGTLTYR
ncbi:MAG TPA: NAD(P)/FAD-dependent oxidoreductase, partial [Acidimicrobiales bacterium]|nr:NAD(P)/FAD-dependent oxidoreductase [Acidimicrobiales bacterium]